MRITSHSRKLVDGNQDLDAEFLGVLDVLDQVLASFLQRNKILLGICLVESFPRCHVRPAAMHFQGTSGRNNDGCIRRKATDSTLYVAELLHPHISPETTLGEDIAYAIRGIAFFGAR